MEKLEKLLFDYDGTTELSRLDSLDFLHGFIKWLVENDKIDRDKVDDKFERPFYGYTNYEIVLMLLSISSSPIDDLILYLN